MRQSRRMSLVEAIANVVVGYGVAVVTQILIFPVFGLNVTLTQNLQIGAIFTVVSIARSFGSGGYSRRSGCEARESVVRGLIDCRATR